MYYIVSQDEQLEDMNSLVDKNMELEAKLSLLISDRKVSDPCHKVASMVSTQLTHDSTSFTIQHTTSHIVRVNVVPM